MVTSPIYPSNAYRWTGNWCEKCLVGGPLLNVSRFSRIAVCRMFKWFPRSVPFSVHFGSDWFSWAIDHSWMVSCFWLAFPLRHINGSCFRSLFLWRTYQGPGWPGASLLQTSLPLKETAFFSAGEPQPTQGTMGLIDVYLMLRYFFISI